MKPARLVWRAALVVGLAVHGSLPVPSAGARTRTVDLNRDADMTIVGEAFISSIGDVNGDGLADMALGNQGALELDDRGRVYVVFGSAERITIDVNDPLDLTQHGFRIDGASLGDYLYFSSGIGDVNGDGLDDFVVGAPGADNNGRNASGSAYVVFGKKTPEPIDLNLFDLGAQATLATASTAPVSSTSLASRPPAWAMSTPTACPTWPWAPTGERRPMWSLARQTPHPSTCSSWKRTRTAAWAMPSTTRCL